MIYAIKITVGWELAAIEFMLMHVLYVYMNREMYGESTTTTM